MIKKSVFISIGIILFLVVASSSVLASSNYCPIYAKSPSCYEHITRVNLNGNEKVSGGSNYSDFTNAILTTLNVGTTYTLSVDINTSGNYTEYVKAWIDFNNDVVFSGDEEINLGKALVSGNRTFNNTFTVPSNAVLSETRMRVYLKWSAAPSPCENVTFGEVEDYKIKILPLNAICADGTTQPCDSSNCTGIQTCANGTWGACNAGCLNECGNKCVGNIWYYSGNYSLQSYNCSYSTQNCDLQDGCYAYQTGCEDRDYFCQVSGCNYTFSNRNTDFNDSFVNYCSADTIRKHKQFHDFYCNVNPNTCTDHTSWIDDRLVEDCNSYDGWYNTTISWVNDTQNTEKEQIKQEYRDYACSNANCTYYVNDTKLTDTGKIRNKAIVTYCSASTGDSYSEYITRVSLNGNSKISGSSKYSNFTNTTLATLNTGTSYTLYVDAKTTGNFTEYVKAWIDFNNDGMFSGDEEINLGSAKFYGNRTFNKTFTVPINATIIETRMRVYLKWAGAPSPCENATFGEIEDYRIKIL